MTEPKHPILYADPEDIHEHLAGRLSNDELVKRAVDHMNEVVFRDSIAARVFRNVAGATTDELITAVVMAGVDSMMNTPSVLDRVIDSAFQNPPSVQDFINAANTLRQHALPWHVGTVTAPLLRRLAPPLRRPLCSYGAAILAARSLLA